VFAGSSLWVFKHCHQSALFLCQLSYVKHEGLAPPGPFNKHVHERMAKRAQLVASADCLPYVTQCLFLFVQPRLRPSRRPVFCPLAVPIKSASCGVEKPTALGTIVAVTFS